MAQLHLSGQNRGFLGEINGRGGKTGWVFSNPGEIQPWARMEALSHQCPGAGMLQPGKPRGWRAASYPSPWGMTTTKERKAADTQGWRAGKLRSWHGGCFSVAMGRGLGNRDKGGLGMAAGIKGREMREGAKKRWGTALEEMPFTVLTSEGAHTAAELRHIYWNTCMTWTHVSAWIYTHRLLWLWGKKLITLPPFHHKAFNQPTA